MSTKQSTDKKEEAENVTPESAPAPEDTANTLPEEPIAEVSGSNEEANDEFNIKVKRKRSKKPLIFGIIVILAAVAVLYFKPFEARPKSVDSVTYETAVAEKRDITQILSGSASLSPADSYTVSTLITGDILSANFEEGDVVEKDDILYIIDSSDMDISIERSEIALEQSRLGLRRLEDSLDALTIKSTDPGTIVNMLVEVGDDVVAGQTVATVRESGTMQLTLPFSVHDTAGFFVGQQATITLQDSFETIYGTISEISAVEQVYQGNIPVNMVEIDVTNPGGLSSLRSATATIGGAACVGAAEFQNKSEYSIISTGSGKVTNVYYKEGQNVGKKKAVVQLSNTSLQIEWESTQNTIHDAELGLQSQKDRLDDYQIKSPIYGTVVEKHLKQGDTLDAGVPMCSIFDLTYLKLVLNVDELDVINVREGQEVSLTSDAIIGETYHGYITKVSINGISMNGITAYPVTIRIDEMGKLLPGMNVDAEIIVSENNGVLAIPNTAILRGNRVMVKVREPEEGEVSEDGKLPAGYEYRDVVLGANDDDYVQVLSGVNEGEVVALAASSDDSGMIMTPLGPMPAGALGGTND